MSATANISVRALVVSGVLALAIAAFLVRGSASGITFALEDNLNLTIDSRAFYNGLPVLGSTWTLKDLIPGADKFFNIEDIVPGDSGKAVISMHIESNRQDAWLCLDFTNLVSDENGFVEPESGVDASEASGELADGMEFFAWRDDGDDVFEVGEEPLFGTGAQSASVVLNATTYPIADSTIGPPLPDGTVSSVGIAWCAGDLQVNLATAEINCAPGALGNAAQTDSLSVDVAIRAATERNNSGFTCEGGGDSGRGRPPRPERDERDEREERPERPDRPPRLDP